MYCPSCENLMSDDAKYCGHCGLVLNKKSLRLERLCTDVAWIWRRGWAGFAAGFTGWIIVFVISRIIGQNTPQAVSNLVSGMVCGVFLGVVGGIMEESLYKATIGGLLGCLGGATGGGINLCVSLLIGGTSRASSPFSILLTWACVGLFIGAASGIIERNRRKIIAGALCGLMGGLIGGLLGSLFYGSAQIEFKPEGWLVKRALEGLSGGLVGAVVWFFIGSVEKLYIFRRREDQKLGEKACDVCKHKNLLRFWYCVSCGSALQVEAPRKKLPATPLRGMERVEHAFRFLSWLAGATGVITAPIIFVLFLTQDFVLALISVVFTVLFFYLMVVLFRAVADFLSCLMIRCDQPEE